jgi:hypothetical protein
MMTYTIYVCPEDHWLDGGTPVESWWRGQGRVCSMCNRPVDEVEVVRVDDLLGDEAIERAMRSETGLPFGTTQGQRVRRSFRSAIGLPEDTR